MVNVENMEISSSGVCGPYKLTEGVCSWSHQRQEYLLTLVECAEDEAGEELHVVFYMLIVGRGWGTGRKGERREGRHCRRISEYEGWEMGVHSYGFWFYYIP